MGMDGVIYHKIVTATHVKINAKHTRFMQAQAVEGPIVSTTGLVVATTTAALLATEYAEKRRAKEDSYNTQH